MTRHQRRKAAAAKAVAKANAAIVRANLSTPVVREHTEQLISQVYANRMDVARGRGTTAGGFRPKVRLIQKSPWKPGPRATEQGAGWNPNA